MVWALSDFLVWIKYPGFNEAWFASNIFFKDSVLAVLPYLVKYSVRVWTACKSRYLGPLRDCEEPLELLRM
jgi:hypothetical protein